VPLIGLGHGQGPVPLARKGIDPVVQEGADGFWLANSLMGLMPLCRPWTGAPCRYLKKSAGFLWTAWLLRR
jgi:hypothetical protein